MKTTAFNNLSKKEQIEVVKTIKKVKSDIEELKKELNDLKKNQNQDYVFTTKKQQNRVKTKGPNQTFTQIEK